MTSLPAAIAGGLALCAAPLAAQEDVAGSVVDGSGIPVAGAVVVLHGLSDAGGAELDRDTSDATGAFVLQMPEGNASMYFVATRLGGELYVGPTFRTAPPEPYVLPAGAGVQPFLLAGEGALPPARGGAPAAGAAGRVAPTRGGGDAWWVALIAAAIIALVALLALRGRARPSRSRELMVEIARLDRRQRQASAAESPAPVYDERRAELRRQLDEAIALEGDAAGL